MGLEITVPTGIKPDLLDGFLPGTETESEVEAEAIQMTVAIESCNKKDRKISTCKTLSLLKKELFTQSNYQRFSKDPYIVGILFATCGISYLFINKYILMKYCHYPMITLSLFGQVIIVSLQKVLSSEQRNDDSYDIQYVDVKRLMPIAVCQLFSLTLAQYALKNLNIAILDTLKRCISLFHLFFYYTILTSSKQRSQKSKYSPFQIFSLLIISVGTIVSLAYDTNFAWKVALLGFLSLFFKSFYQALVEKYGKMHYSTPCLIYKVTILSVFIMPMSCYLIEGEQVSFMAEDWKNYFEDNSTLYVSNNPKNTTNKCSTITDNQNAIFTFVIEYIVLAIGGFFIKFITFRALKVIGALHCSIISLTKTLLTTSIGLILFNDVDITMGLIIGLILRTPHF